MSKYLYSILNNTTLPFPKYVTFLVRAQRTQNVLLHFGVIYVDNYPGKTKVMYREIFLKVANCNIHIYVISTFDQVQRLRLKSDF